MKGERARLFGRVLPNMNGDDKIFFVLDAKVKILDMAGGKPAPFPGMSTVKTIQTIDCCLNAYNIYPNGSHIFLIAKHVSHFDLQRENQN